MTICLKKKIIFQIEYYISYLIDEICNQSYDLFKELDGNGNLIDHLYTGLIQKKIKENAIKEQDNFDNSKEIIVGANKLTNGIVYNTITNTPRI